MICFYYFDEKQTMDETFICRYCGKVCKNLNSHSNHERCCPKNQNRNYKNGMTGKKPWNFGKTKENDERLMKASITLKKRYASGELKKYFLGKHHSEETKIKISETQKDYYKNHPDLVPYKKYHHSKGDSYPEKYFKNILIRNNIEFEQNYYTCGYYLDFAIINKHIYFEVDGEQHYNDKRIVEHDIIRTKKLNDNGWTCVLRIRWSDYKKLSKADKQQYINNLLCLLGQ